jgi:hypothetical protein
MILYATGQNEALEQASEDEHAIFKSCLFADKLGFLVIVQFLLP